VNNAASQTASSKHHLLVGPKFLAVGTLSENLLVQKLSSENAQFGNEKLQFGENLVGRIFNTHKLH